jgi:hypothetical protein
LIPLQPSDMVKAGAVFTVMVSVAIEAHCPAVGVNVYVVVLVLSNAGDQVPVNPSLDVVGNASEFPPEQMGATAVKAGVTSWFTVIVRVAAEAHCPVAGVNVYIVVAVLFKAGDQLPVIPLLEVVGNALKVSPEQIGATAVKVGIVVVWFTVIVSVVAEAHCPAVGVNV